MRAAKRASAVQPPLLVAVPAQEPTSPPAPAPVVAAPSLVPVAIESAIEQVSEQAAIMARYGSDLQGATDLELAMFYDLAEAAQSDLKDRLSQVMTACKRESERRIRAQGLTPQGGGELVVPGFDVKLVPEYEYLTDVNELRAIQKLLADNPAAAKLVKYTPRRWVEVEEVWEAGNTRSILSIKDKFPQFAEQFARAIKRADKAPKLVIKRRETIASVKNVTPVTERDTLISRNGEA